MFLFKKRYYYVPPCPKCQARNTGRYLQLSVKGKDIDRVTASHLLKGEIVSVIPVLYDTRYENAFCENCGCEWRANITVKYLSKQEIEQERIDRGITKEKYISTKDLHKNNKKEMKAKKKQHKKELREQRKKRREKQKLPKF